MYFSKAMIYSLLFLAGGCGLTQPSFKDYEDEKTKSDGPASAETACGAAALALFTSEVGPGIDGKCATAGCHASGSVGATTRPLTAGAFDTNRASLFGYTGLDRDKLTTKISAATHGGGDVSTSLPKENITAWLDKEAECAETAAAR